MNRSITLLLLISSLLFMEACVSLQHSPVSDTRRLYAYSWSQEVQLGREVDQQISDYYGIYDDPELTEYITMVGKRVLEVSHMRRDDTRRVYRETPFTFRVLDSPVVNAFALPGGYNYVTRGLLTHMTSEAQLAMVLGHEVAHVAARHASQQALRQQAGSILLVGTAILGEELLGIPGQEIIGIGGTAAQLMFLSYSRDAERESDRLGVEYAAKAGYAAAEGAGFFTTLKRISDRAGHSLPSFLSSHPDPGEREREIVRLANQWKERGFPQETLNQREFYAAIEGMITGDNPREGFVRNQTFYHPDLAFSFPVPQDWRVINERREVVLVPSDQKGVTILTIPQAQSAAVAVDEIGNLDQVSVLSRTNERINGNNAYVLKGRMIDNNTPYILHVTAIEFDGRVYRFLSYATEADSDRFNPHFNRTARGFNQVTDSAILDIQPNRIHILEVASTAPFSQLIPDDIPDGYDPEELAIINQVQLDDIIEAGRLLKFPRQGGR